MGISYRPLVRDYINVRPIFLIQGINYFYIKGKTFNGFVLFKFLNWSNGVMVYSKERQAMLGLYSNIILNSFDIVYNLLRVSSLMDMVGFEHCLPGFNGYHWRICLHENRNESNHDNSRICEKLCMILA